MNVEAYTRKNTEAWELLARFMPLEKNSRRMSFILANTARETGLLSEQIKGPARTQPIARARQLFMARAVEAGHSRAAVGRFLGRDHTSVIHGIKVIAEVQAGLKEALIKDGVA